MDFFEGQCYEAGYRNIAGIDEAGRGPLAGPVVAAAVIFSRGWIDEEITDSKRLSPKKREELYAVYMVFPPRFPSGSSRGEIPSAFPSPPHPSLPK
jgi:hypothetical protein